MNKIEPIEIANMSVYLVQFSRLLLLNFYHECVNMSYIMCGALHVYRINVAIARFYVFAVRGVRSYSSYGVRNIKTTHYCTARRPTLQLRKMSVVYYVIFFIFRCSRR